MFVLEYLGMHNGQIVADEIPLDKPLSTPLEAASMIFKSLTNKNLVRCSNWHVSDKDFFYRLNKNENTKIEFEMVRK